jgi:hypothetical protein
VWFFPHSLYTYPHVLQLVRVVATARNGNFNKLHVLRIPGKRMRINSWRDKSTNGRGEVLK